MTRRDHKLLQQPPRVVERYFRLRMYILAKAMTQAIARRLARPRLQWNERKRHIALVSALETMALETARSRRHNFQASTAVLNLALFFLIAERDVQTLKIDALTHPNAWQRSLCARVILLTIHELDMDKVAGNRLRQALVDANVPEEVQKEVAVCLRAVRSAQQKAQKQFMQLRNSTIAHRDPDAQEQYRAITQLDEVAVVRVAAEFYSGTHAFIALLPKVVQHVSGIPGLVSQLSAQSRRKA